MKKLLILILLFIIVKSSSDLLSHDLIGLEMIYNTTDGNHWIINKGWMTNASYCTWYGVKCNCEGNVTEIRLRANNLNGYLPNFSEDTLDLVSLIDMSGNKIHGNIKALAKLDSLISVDLQNSHVTDEIGDTFFSSKNNFTYINLAMNNLYGTIPAIIPTLHNLYLTDNDLWGSFPEINTDLEYQLVGLYLSNNKLDGTIPDTFSNMRSLEEFYISTNNFYGNLPGSLSMTNLLHLDVSYNNFSSEIPKSYTNLTNLSVFLASNNSLIGQINSLMWLPKLIIVEVMNNELTEIPLAYFRDSMARIFLGRNNNFSGLIDLGNTNIPKVIDVSVNERLMSTINNVDDKSKLQYPVYYYHEYICKNVLLENTLVICDPRFFNYSNCQKI